MVASLVLGISLVDQAEDLLSLLRVVAEGAVQAFPAVEVLLPQAKGRKGNGNPGRRYRLRAGTVSAVG